MTDQVRYILNIEMEGMKDTTTSLPLNNNLRTSIKQDRGISITTGIE